MTLIPSFVSAIAVIDERYYIFKARTFSGFLVTPLLKVRETPEMHCYPCEQHHEEQRKKKMSLGIFSALVPIGQLRGS